MAETRELVSYCTRRAGLAVWACVLLACISIAICSSTPRKVSAGLLYESALTDSAAGASTDLADLKNFHSASIGTADAAYIEHPRPAGSNHQIPAVAPRAASLRIYRARGPPVPVLA